MAFTTLTVSVPAGKEAQLLRYAASLATNGSPEVLEDEEEFPQSNGKKKWGWGRKSVQDAYLGGVSNVWQPFLDYLADRPDEWVAWADLCKFINRTPREASGMLGAAERRCGGRPPYEKKWEDGQRLFRMPSSVADIINAIREENEEQFPQ